MEGLRSFNLRRQFATTSLAVIVAIALGLGALLSQMLTERMLRREGEVSMEFIRNLLATDRSADFLRAPDDQELKRRFLVSMNHLSVMTELMRANAFGPDGRVVWSTDARLIGRNFVDNKELWKALRGELVVHSGSLGREREKEEHADLSDRSHYYVESYIPVMDGVNPRQVIGVVELYKVPVQLSQAIREAVLQLWIACAGSAVVLFLALNSVVGRADRIMRAQQARLAESQALSSAVELAGAVAHNLRNPLASIRTAAEMMDGEATPAERTEHREDIIASVDRANRWITELVRVSHAGQLPVEPVATVPMWRDCLQELQPDMQRQHVRWQLQEEEAPPVCAHPAMLRQILLSVLANAIEAMPQGGSLAIGWEAAGGELQITVDDAGVGISEDARLALFRPFFSTKSGGLGIGLALARRTLVQWGGSIDLRSRAGFGSRVTMTLPLAATQERADVAQLLVIEDELILAKNMARYFERAGHAVALAHDGLEGLRMARETPPDVAIVDFQLPSLDGLEVIRELRRMDAEVCIVMITGHGSINLAVEAMKAGSMDLLTKPLSLGSLDEVVQRALKERAGRGLPRYHRQRDQQHASLDALIGDCPQIRALRQLVEALAQSEPNDGAPLPAVLIQGETGTGKELVARACHLASQRGAGPFIAVNCAALPASLMEDELFGHEKGAFTDARKRKSGLIEAADGGTLFLDEIGELDPMLQAKLLRVLEDLRVRPIGALSDRRVNVRFVAATNRELARDVEAGRFRADLLYRLSVFEIRIPPLRQRDDDVLLLAREFLHRLTGRYGRPPMTLEDDAIQALRSYRWPGNVRELRNCLERAVLMQRGPQLRAADLGLPAASTAWSQGVPVGVPAGVTSSAPSSLESLERQHLLEALDANGWNVSLAARALQITRDTLRYRMAKHGLQRGLTH